MLTFPEHFQKELNGIDPDLIGDWDDRSKSLVITDRVGKERGYPPLYYIEHPRDPARPQTPGKARLVNQKDMDYWRKRCWELKTLYNGSDVKRLENMEDKQAALERRERMHEIDCIANDARATANAYIRSRRGF